MRILIALLAIAGLPFVSARVAGAQTERCTDVAACESALAAGRYEEAELGLTRLAAGRASASGPASVALGRVLLETGRYEEAAARARRHASRQSSPPSSRGALRVTAATLLGEAEMARGRYDEAQAAFESVLGESSAHRARLMLGRLLMRRGRRTAARMPLMALVQAYNREAITSSNGEGLAYVAVAIQLIGGVREANSTYQESARAAPERVETQLEWARLFMRHYDAGNAEASVAHALERNPNHPVAHALIARIRLEQTLDFVEAQAALDRALAVNPNLVMAHVTRAGISIRDMDLTAADAHLDAALAINPNDLEALSVRAALRFLEGDQRAYRAATRDVLQRNAQFSEMYTIIAEFANWEHRYPQIVEMAREALRLDPEDSLAHATLGMNLLRMGREEEGLAALREAWRRDHYNVRVYNMLNLFDETLTPQYESVEARPFIFRMHRDERVVMAPLLTETLRRAWNDMRRRYGFTPTNPVHLEMFSSTEHFSVRTSGLPNVGVQGVCFGQLITALSPRAGPFNWAQITWHELAHVFHIQLSNNTVPRWFTEGLAEYETIIARPEWRREEDHRLYAALSSQRLPPLRQLNHAFTHARTPEDMTVAYYASSMLVKYIAERFGFPRVVDMLREWGNGRETSEVIQRALRVSIDELDAAFRQHTQERLASRADDFTVDFAAYRDLDAARAALATSPNDADAHAVLAASLAVNGEVEEAAREVRAALMANRDQPMARFVAARLAVLRREPRTALGDLRLLIESGHDGYEVRLFRARIALGLRNVRLARSSLEAATRIDAGRAEAWQGLMQIAERTSNAQLRSSTLRHLVDIDQHDRASNRALLAELVTNEEWDEALIYGERGLYVDPFGSETRHLYAQALIGANRGAEALREADAALATSPEHPAPVHLTRARALMLLRRTRQAREAAAAAVAADPSVADHARAITSSR